MWPFLLAMSEGRLLVFNCHEAWVHQLEGVGWDLDIVVGLAGRYTSGWDERMRPLPRGSRLMSLEQAVNGRGSYHAVIVHNVTDLLDARSLAAPKLAVLHTTLEGRLIEENSRVDPREMGALLQQLLQLIGGHAVAVSQLKGRSWGVLDDIVPFGVDPDAYALATLEREEGLRISNLFTKRRRILLGDLHEAAFRDVPLRIVGHNPDIPGSRAATSWDELKGILAVHRFYVHTAHPELEDGYNMATLEAMAAGLPVLGNAHPTSPIEHGVNGFLSDDPAELASHARELLADRDKARRMGLRARDAVSERFHVRHFRAGIRASLGRARTKYGAH